MNLALHVASPRIEAFYQYYTDHHAEKQNVEQRVNCDSWVDWYGQVVCDSETLAHLAGVETIDPSSEMNATEYVLHLSSFDCFSRLLGRTYDLNSSRLTTYNHPRLACLSRLRVQLYYTLRYYLLISGSSTITSTPHLMDPLLTLNMSSALSRKRRATSPRDSR